MPVLDLIRERARERAAGEVPLLRTSCGSTPLVFDSPHSGTWYPGDFGFACELAVLRRAEDTHVERLFDFAPALGIAWVEALFPRSYVDVNRGEHELDPSMLQGDLARLPPADAASLEKVRLGKGLLWRCTDDGVPIYDRPLPVAEALRRIERCWRPYHHALAQAIHAARTRHGWCLHVNCHSMPSVAGSHATLHPGLAHPDFVLGDRDGTTASPRLAQRVAGVLRGFGYSVAINHPYKGVELVRRHGAPAEGRHSLQLEINRRLYMDEGTLELHAGSERLREHLRELAEALLQLRRLDLV